ncbi:Flp pilus assembly protein CpaB [Massilia sp. CF038]|uniref:Flp pilus assembly protein CpaB n=1 Tax=Massilia sp. CF038 TaxID=1881045 RepID=UPI0009225743|nr:Flp pilus assembly protein CpaB [Massilia sp. CF038]SHH40869.1 pilus assembly protein CpaB [Massilia sp. CF038]
MKNKRALVMMAVAVLFGIAAVALAWKWLQGQANANSNRVVVATTDVNRGQRLAPEMLKLVERPAKEIPKDAFTDTLTLTERVLKVNLQKGEVVAESKLAPAGTMGGLSALISEGKRAITVRVNDVIGVAGFALPGNYVDIIVHTERDPAEGERSNHGQLDVSKIVLERILVLAVAQEVSRDETKPKVVNAVTLEVTPEQAENLDLARGVGTLSLALRNQIDHTVPETAGATKRTLLDELAQVAAKPKPAPVAPVKHVAVRSRPVSAPGAVAAPQPKRDCVSVLNGLQTSQECF